MGYADRMFEEALESLREDNKKLRENLDRHVQIGAEFSGIINEMLGRFHDLNKEDYNYFCKIVEKALQRSRKIEKA